MGNWIPESPEDVFPGASTREDVTARTPEAILAAMHATVGVATDAEAQRADALSARQREVLELVAACLEEAEIADSAPYRARDTRGSEDVAAERG
jgi:hypothetical protein